MHLSISGRTMMKWQILHLQYLIFTGLLRSSFQRKLFLKEAKEFSHQFLQERQRTNQLLDKCLISKNLHAEVIYIIVAKQMLLPNLSRDLNSSIKKQKYYEQIKYGLETPCMPAFLASMLDSSSSITAQSKYGLASHCTGKVTSFMYQTKLSIFTFSIFIFMFLLFGMRVVQQEFIVNST